MINMNNKSGRDVFFAAVTRKAQVALFSDPMELESCMIDFEIMLPKGNWSLYLAYSQMEITVDTIGGACEFNSDSEVCRDASTNILTRDLYEQVIKPTLNNAGSINLLERLLNNGKEILVGQRDGLWNFTHPDGWVQYTPAFGPLWAIYAPSGAILELVFAKSCQEAAFLYFLNQYHMDIAVKRVQGFHMARYCNALE